MTLITVFDDSEKGEFSSVRHLGGVRHLTMNSLCICYILFLSLLSSMHLAKGNFYHVYNRGNNRQPIFFSHDNYIFFLNKIRQYILPVSDVLSWCLMPNHFHLLIQANSCSVKTIERNKLETQQFSEAVRLLLSSYTKAINKQRGFTGNLFQQKTKARVIEPDRHHLMIAFHYLHQNPYKAGLVKRMEDWEYSSFRDYSGLRNGNLCNKTIAKQYLNIQDE